MNNLLIIGAGNVGGFLSYNIEEFGSFDVLGFLDDDISKINKTFYGRKVLGSIDSIEEYLEYPKLTVVIGISSPVIRMNIVEKFGKYPITYPNFIAKNVWLSKNVNLGKGVIIYPGVSINYESEIGDYSIINMNCAIGHNCMIGRYSSLAPGINLAGFTKIEECSTIGIGVSTRQNIKIGKRATVGGQSMIVKDVEANSTVFGVPAKAHKLI